jgi:hypothetical protein
VLAGDTLTYLSEVTALRVLESRPQWGLVGFLNTATNQRRTGVFLRRESLYAAQAVCVGQPGYCKSAARSCHGEGGSSSESLPAWSCRIMRTGNYIQS